MKQFVLILSLAASMSVNGQAFVESFADGNFTALPAWTASDPQWLVVANSDVGPGATGSNTLRLNAPGGNPPSPVWLYTANNITWGTFQAWSAWIGRRIAASTADQSIVWLFANETTLTSVTVDGYRIVFGGNGNDAVVLQRVDNGVPTTIGTSSTAVTDGLSDYGFRVRVTRNAANQWEIFTGVDLSTITAGGGELPTASAFTITSFSSGVLNEPGTPVPITGLGYLAVEAVHGNGSSQKTGAEFDQLGFHANGFLPVTLTNFQATKDANKVRLNWTVETETNFSGYEVQRSGNGVDFSKIGFVKASGQHNYSFLDEQPLNGTAYYRLKNIDIDGTFDYSFIVNVSSSKGQFVRVFPVPATSELFVQHHEAKKGAQLKVTSMEGRTIKLINVPANSVQTNINLSTFQAGVYFVVYDSGDGNKMTSRFVKQ